MVGKIDKTPQLNMFQTPLKQFIKDKHELVLLSQKIDWDKLEQELSVYYCTDNGRPSVPIRTIAGIVILKRVYDQSDESILDRWVENPYWQFFCGEVCFQHKLPFDRTELIKFRKRIGDAGSEKILRMSVQLFSKKEYQEKNVLIDTTVQEKNITYPTDVKLQKKIIEKCRNIAKEEGVKLRQSYKRELKQLMIDQRFHNHPKRKKKAKAAARRIKVIAGRVCRDINRKLEPTSRCNYQELLDLFEQILNQKRTDSNKAYSIHQPHVLCIAKGKEAKKFEFGNKSSIVKTKNSGIIVGAMAFDKNLYDGDTLTPQLQQVEELTERKPKRAIVDRGYRGRKEILGTKIISPKKLPQGASRYQKQRLREFFRARAGIEPVIGHLKQDHRMGRNFLLDEEGDRLNTILAATGFNIRKMLQRIKAEAIYTYFKFLDTFWSIKYGLNYSV